MTISAHELDDDARNSIIAMALDNGVEDDSYKTERHGTVQSFSGQAYVEHEACHYLVIGHGPAGTADEIHKPGWLEVIRL